MKCKKELVKEILFIVQGIIDCTVVKSTETVSYNKIISFPCRDIGLE